MLAEVILVRGILGFAVGKKRMANLIFADYSTGRSHSQRVGERSFAGPGKSGEQKPHSERLYEVIRGDSQR